MNRNFNQLTKTIALSLILAIVSGFGNDSINAQVPTQPPVQATPQSCPTENLDLNQLRTNLNERYNIFNNSLPGLFTSLRDPDTQLETIRTQDQITKLGSIYQCVLEAQDNANLGAREQRIAIRQTITDISAILTPARDNGFTEDTLNTLRTNLNIVEEGIYTTIDEIERNLQDLSTQLNSQIQALDNTSTNDSTGNGSNQGVVGVVGINIDSPTDSLTRGILTIVGALAVVLLILLMRKNRKNRNVLNSEQDKEKDKQLYQELKQELKQELTSEFYKKFTQLEEEIYLKSQLSPPDQGSHTQQVLMPLPGNISSPQETINLYPNTPKVIETKGVGVSETRESFGKRWSGLVVPIVLEPASNYNFLIINDRELIPKPGSKITETKLNTIDGLFEYQNFRSGAPFQVIQPAIVSIIPGDRWQVTQKGVLHFE